MVMKTKLVLVAHLFIYLKYWGVPLLRNNITLTLTIPLKSNLTEDLGVPIKIRFVLIEPNAPPVNVQGHNTSSTSIWVDWDTVPAADQNGIIRTYTVTYTAFPGGILRRAIVNAPTTHVTLRGLKEYTNYSILVFASTAKGDGNASDPIIVTTDEDSKLPKTLRHLTIKRGMCAYDIYERDKVGKL